MRHVKLGPDRGSARYWRAVFRSGGVTGTGIAWRVLQRRAHAPLLAPLAQTEKGGKRRSGAKAVLRIRIRIQRIRIILPDPDP